MDRNILNAFRKELAEKIKNVRVIFKEPNLDKKLFLLLCYANDMITIPVHLKSIIYYIYIYISIYIYIYTQTKIDINNHENTD
jgi:hypothetical protein